MTGPYPPDHGTVLSEVTVTRDGDDVLVCGVRLTEDEARGVAYAIQSHAAAIRREREQRGQEAEAEASRAAWRAGAVSGADMPSGAPVRLLPNGRIDAGSVIWCSSLSLRPTLDALLAACPTPRRLWWVGSRGMRHLDGCGCWHNSSLSDARLLPADERPAKVCKRSLRKLAAEVTP